MALTVYSLKTCDTCRKALKALEAANVAHEVVDVRSDGVPEDIVRGWLAAPGADVIVNRRSTTWRNLSDEEKAGAEDLGKMRALLSENPTLIKRPVIVDGETVHVGWTKDVQAALL